MPLNLNKLERPRARGDKTVARCPACAASGNDRSAEHLVIFPGGAFACCAFPGDKEHRRQIAEFAGMDAGKHPLVATIVAKPRVRCPTVPFKGRPL